MGLFVAPSSLGFRDREGFDREALRGMDGGIIRKRHRYCLYRVVLEKTVTPSVDITEIGDLAEQSARPRFVGFHASHSRQRVVVDRVDSDKSQLGTQLELYFRRR